MPRLFIDIDDTLIIYPQHQPGPNPMGVTNGLPYETNESLVEAIKTWLRRDPNGQVVIWSGGGEEYARTISAGILVGVAAWYFTKSGQNLTLPGPDDIVVDDDHDSLGPNMVSPRIFLPDQFIELMNG